MADTVKKVDPRRVERIRKAKKRRLKFFLIVFLIIALIVFGILAVTVLFPVKSIKVSGSKIYSEDAVIKASGIKGENLIILSEDDLEESLREELPYVDKISLDKSLPDTVSIKITDAKEYASYFISGKYYVVSKKGYVLRTDVILPENTIEIITKAKKNDLGKKIKFSNLQIQKINDTIISNLEKQNIKINTIDTSNTLKISVVVDGRFSVNFGTENYLERKCAHLATMIKNIESDAKGDINLSMWTPDKPEGSLIRRTEEKLCAEVLEYLSKVNVIADEVSAADDKNITVMVEGKFTVNLGDESYLKEKCEYLSKLIKGMEEPNSIDLSKWTPKNQQVDLGE